jgi:hypothetical protein
MLWTAALLERLSASTMSGGQFVRHCCESKETSMIKGKESEISNFGHILFVEKLKIRVLKFVNFHTKPESQRRLQLKS